MTRATALSAAGLVVAALLGGCGGTVATPAPVPATPGTTALEPSLSTETGTPAVSVTPVPLPTPGTSPTGVRLDESLLDMLPAEIDGVPVAPEAQSFTDAVSDPAFAANVDAAAFFVAVEGGNIASGGLARLRPGLFSAAFFRDWRDTYNDGACGQAGGVAGNAEAELGGRTVYITTCVGDLRVYHAYVEERGVLVSLFSLGERHLGEQLMGALRP